MDDRTFDDLTRFIGKRASRRAVVRGATAAALAALFGPAATGDRNNAEAMVSTQGGVKQRIRSFCNQAGQACKNSLNPTRRCCYRCGPGKRCCEAHGYACTQDSHCCDGRICRDPNLADGVDLKGCFVSGELEVFAECEHDSECASFNCVSGVCCTPEQTCEGGNTCCSPDEACIQDGCCPIEQVCDVDAYDGFAAACCDPYTEGCSMWGCCPLANLCGDECCKPDIEYCAAGRFCLLIPPF